MPCYRCGVRQADPVRGASPWRRGVRDGSLVLVCPDCQRVHDWVADLDRCLGCGSVLLSRVLGETRCRDCGAAVAEPAAGGQGGGRASGLADEVGSALERHFGRSGPRGGR